MLAAGLILLIFFGLPALGMGVLLKMGGNPTTQKKGKRKKKKAKVSARNAPGKNNPTNLLVFGGGVTVLSLGLVAAHFLSS